MRKCLLLINEVKTEIVSRPMSCDNFNFARHRATNHSPIRYRPLDDLAAAAGNAQDNEKNCSTSLRGTVNRYVKVLP